MIYVIIFVITLVTTNNSYTHQSALQLMLGNHSSHDSRWDASFHHDSSSNSWSSDDSSDDHSAGQQQELISLYCQSPAYPG